MIERRAEDATRNGAARDAQADVANVASVRARVLVIEPDGAIRSLLAAILRRENFEVTALTIMSSALPVLADGSFDCIVVGSPVVVESNFQPGTFLSHVGRTHPEWAKRIVVVTTWVDSLSLLESARRAGVYAVFGKPFPSEALVEVVRACAAGEPAGQRWFDVPQAVLDELPDEGG